MCWPKIHRLFFWLIVPKGLRQLRARSVCLAASLVPWWFFRGAGFSHDARFSCDEFPVVQWWTAARNDAARRPELRQTVLDFRPSFELMADEFQASRTCELTGTVLQRAAIPESSSSSSSKDWRPSDAEVVTLVINASLASAYSSNNFSALSTVYSTVW